MNEVTQILSDLAQGDAHAGAQLLPLVYDELRRLAAARLAAEPSGHTLQPTALVHEAYLRLVGTPDGDRWGHQAPRRRSAGRLPRLGEPAAAARAGAGVSPTHPGQAGICCGEAGRVADRKGTLSSPSPSPPPGLTTTRQPTVGTALCPGRRP